MAIQIVDSTPDPSVVRHCVCRSCGVKLAYVKPDTKRDYTSDYLGDKDWYTYIDCPACREKVTVKDW